MVDYTAKTNVTAGEKKGIADITSIVPASFNDICIVHIVTELPLYSSQLFDYWKNNREHDPC